MPTQLFNLRGVPEDEADDVRDLLAAHGIDFYETPAGNWGVSSPALWVRDDARLTEAKALIETYQAQRAARAREDYRRLKREGRQRTVLDSVREAPLRFIIYVAFIFLVLYFVIKPFLDLARHGGH
jgi:hypothetical protein